MKSISPALQLLMTRCVKSSNNPLKPSGPLSSSIPSSAIKVATPAMTSVQKEVAEKKKRGP